MAKKVLLVGSSYSAIPILKVLNDLSYDVSVCGADKNDPCHSIASNSVLIDYSNKQFFLIIFLQAEYDLLYLHATTLPI